MAISSRRNPVETANCISKLFFWWTIDLFRRGAKYGLQPEDIYDPPSSDESERLANRLESAWLMELEKLKHMEYKIDADGNKIATSPRPSLARAIIRTFWPGLVRDSFLLLISVVVLRSVQPIFQGLVISYFGTNAAGPTKDETLLWALGLILTTVGVTFITHHTSLSTQRVGMQVRVACSSLIYRKSLKLSKASLNKTTPGQVVNILSNDVSRFDMLPMYLPHLFIMPIQIIVIGSIMWTGIGLSTLVGIATLLVMTIPLQVLISQQGGKLRGKIARLTDRRVQLMNELISGIQVIKTYAWEKPFNKIVSLTRRAEVKSIMSSASLKALYLGLIVITERTTLFTSVVSFILLKNRMSAQITFQLATYFNAFQLACAISFPQALIMGDEALISIRRLEKFLLLDEIEYPSDDSKSNQQTFPKSISSPKSAVTVNLQHVSANWEIGQLPPTLCNVSMKIEGGKLCTLVGHVGSGKSSLLNLLLNELPVGAGTVQLSQFGESVAPTNASSRGFIKDHLDMKISFASQDAWLFFGSLRENILFGQPYDPQRYQEVTRVCSLVRDFKQLPEGDMTVVGERGMSLSGGQRARINLARAIYRQADLYLLDDPLSAVDARVARRLFKDCIVGYLKGKTRILVTHQLHFLEQADVIVVLEKGTVKCQGTFDELSSSNEDFHEVLNQMQKKEAEENPGEEEQLDDLDEDFVAAQRLEVPFINHIREGTAGRRRRVSQLSSGKSSIRSVESFAYDNEAAAAEAMDKRKAIAEVMGSGILPWSVYSRYFRAGSTFCALILLSLLFILGQAATTSVDYWITYWTNVEIIRNALEDVNGDYSALRPDYLSYINVSVWRDLSWLDDDGLLVTEYSIYIYTFCIVCCIVFVMLRSILFVRVCMKSSRRLHGMMFANVLGAPMVFFNTNSTGRILNRFSKDIGAIDELLPKAMLECLQIFFVLMSILIMIIIVNYWMIIPTIVVAVLFYFLRYYFMDSAQDIKRIEGITKSPVFSHVATTMNGLSTIRSRGAEVQVMLQKEFDRYQDKHTGSWYLILATQSAFGLVLDLVSCVFIACVCYSLILMDHGDTMSGSVGLAISQSLILTGMLQYGVRQSTEVQSQMTAVERVLEYSDLPQEEAEESSSPPPPNWPSSGRIQFRNVFMSYKKDDTPVLKNLNITIEPGWKVGVVGRTGAGKSSLIQALFRLTGEGLQGEILIDERDTKNISLPHLRSNISIIPQEPVLFSESLRYNLDPFEKYPDDALWRVLNEVELNGVMLDQMVTEGGTNFSVGQRQLICLARAILRNTRILVLDEATANIDTRTDEMIQHTIRTKFSECTVITIAHRLNTIIDSDRVVVMEGGRMVECSTPYELLTQKPPTQFAKMVNETGTEMANKLLGVASACYHQRGALFSQRNRRSSDADTIEI
ncbi:ATP-binding cassette sub-family C member 4-like [Diachasmimorpha longicaudata]|uniref:ATP-binding cassette sub-family C member 4-like n=1 Tax=Diachasmimorpha longicaudata TaxID=58733 RepID=UPI0030B908E9